MRSHSTQQTISRIYVADGRQRKVKIGNRNPLSKRRWGERGWGGQGAQVVHTKKWKDMEKTWYMERLKATAMRACAQLTLQLCLLVNPGPCPACCAWPTCQRAGNGSGGVHPTRASPSLMEEALICLPGQEASRLELPLISTNLRNRSSHCWLRRLIIPHASRLSLLPARGI